MRILAIFFITSLIYTATPVFAQFSDNPFTNIEIGIKLDPPYPSPGEQVTATLNDYGGGAYGSGINWFLDGEEILNANNQREVVFTAGTAGATQKIEVVLSKPSGGKEVLQSIINPVYLDLIIEPQTRVPDFYLGRSLPSIGSSVNATAVLSGLDLDKNQLVYTWRLNRDVLEGGPLRARNQISFIMPMGKNSILSLTVTDTKGEVLANRAVSILSVEPEILFYEVNSLLGINQRSFSETVPFIGNSLSVKAEPYYLDSRVYNNPDFIEWKIDNTVSNNFDSNPYEVTLKREGASGVSKLGFHVRSLQQISQGARGNIQIKY